MNRLGKRHSALRFFGTFLVALAVIGLVLPPVQVCACNCCTNGEADQKSENSKSEPVAQKSCCCGSQTQESGQIILNENSSSSKSCCSGMCRCGEVDKNGQPYQCCCVQPLEKEVPLPEKNIQKIEISSTFVQPIAIAVSENRCERLFNRTIDRLTPLRLHLMLCVLLN